MCSIKFLIRMPWLYIVIGILLFALMFYAMYDAAHVKVPAYASLQPVRAQVLDVQTPSSRNAEKFDILSLKLANGTIISQRIGVSSPQYLGDAVTAYTDGKTVYELVAHDRVLFAYADSVMQVKEKAQRAKDVMTNPITIALAIFLILIGVWLEIFKRRSPEIFQKYCVCAADRMRLLQQEDH